MRTFLAIKVPENVRKVVYDFAQVEAKKELPIKWVAFENLHITLKFLGEIDEDKRVEIKPAIVELGQRHSPFTIELEGLGCFPNPRNPRVMWVGVKQGGDALCAMAAELEKELARFGFEEETRFHPHLTIGRIKEFCRVDSILAKSISTSAFDVDSVVLFKSILKPAGPIYEELEKFALHVHV